LLLLRGLDEEEEGGEGEERERLLTCCTLLSWDRPWWKGGVGGCVSSWGYGNWRFRGWLLLLLVVYNNMNTDNNNNNLSSGFGRNNNGEFERGKVEEEEE
jgi:hypothetical protein